MQLYKEAKLEQVREKATKTEIPTDDRLASINYDGQPRLRREDPTLKRKKEKSLLSIQGCFDCKLMKHMIRDYLQSLNISRAEARKLEYLNKNK